MDTINMKLSLDAVAFIMLALQKCLLEQEDFVTLMEDMEFDLGQDNFLYVSNKEKYSINMEKLMQDIENETQQQFEFLDNNENQTK